MASYNKVILMGNLTRDPELKYTPQGSAVCEFGVAVNEKYKGRDGQMVENVHFFDVTVWAKTAELVSQYCRKGSSVLVDGKLQQDRWESQDGKKMSKVRVTGERIQFVNTRQGNGQGGQGQGQGGGEPLVTPDAGEDIPF